MTVLLIIAGVTALALITIYSLFAPWWSTRAGLAVFALYWCLALIILHFMAEALWGQSPDWHEDLLVILLEGVMLWNTYIIVSKQLRARRNHEAGH